MITYDSTKCVNCYSCIRVCPAHEANCYEVNKDGFVGIRVDANRCIRCGACIKACSHGARDYTDDTEKFFDDLKKGVQISIIAAPAIKIAFDGYWRQALEWLKSQGVRFIYDVSFGADICTWAHLKYLEQHPDAKLISQPCAAVTNYALIYNHDILDSLSPVHSPMLCTAIYMRKYKKINDRIAALSPCIAKGDEFDATGYVSYNVTFGKIKQYMAEHSIDPKTINVNSNNYCQFEFDHLQGIVGSIYPRPAGLKYNLQLHIPSLSVINTEGVNVVYHELDKYKEVALDDLPQVYDVLSCDRGCNSGPAVGTDYSAFRMESIMHKVKEYNKNRQKKQKTLAGADKEMENFTKTLNLNDFIRIYKPLDVLAPEPTAAQLEEAFRSMLKESKLDRQYNCHACGYASCTDMASAIVKKINVPENCMQHSVKIAHQRADTIRQMNEELSSVAVQLQDVVQMLETEVRSVTNDANGINDMNDQCIVSMGKVGTEIDNVKTHGETIIQAMVGIKESVDNFNKVTADVSAIARNINILALNASIEAAHAGEAGKGFAVVADEVRGLAANSQQSVSQANSQNSEIIAAMNNVNEVVSGLEKTVGELLDMIEGMKLDINENTKRGKAISEEMYKVGGVAENISALVDRTSQIIEQSEQTAQ